MALTTKHLFPFIRMLTKLNLKHELKEFALKKIDVTGKSDEEKEQIQKERGFDLVILIIEKLPNAEKEVFDFLSLYSGRTVDELKEAEISETVGLIRALLQEPAFSSFFQQAVK